MFSQLGGLRQQLADFNSGYVGRDGAKRATHFGRRVGLQIERFQMAWTAIEPEQDTGFGTPVGSICSSPGLAPIGQPQPQRSECADA